MSNIILMLDTCAYLQDLFDHGYSGDDVTPVEGAEKYNTLRYIRNGYARDRIAIFEALT